MSHEIGFTDMEDRRCFEPSRHCVPYHDQSRASGRSSVGDSRNGWYGSGGSVGTLVPFSPDTKHSLAEHIRIHRA